MAAMQYSSNQPKPPMPGSNGVGMAEPDPPQGGYKDVIWAVLFLVNVAAVFVGAAMNFNKISFESNTKATSSNSNFDAIIAALAIGFIGSIAFGVFWIRFLNRPSVASSIIKIAMYVNMGFVIAGAIVALLSGSLASAVIMIIIAGLTLVWYYFVRNRIAFTAVLLEMAAACTREYGSTVYIAIAMQFVSLAWIVLWIIALFGVSEFSTGSRSNSPLIQFFLILSLLWTINVLMNIVQVTVGGVAATWFYRSQTQGVVSSSAKRACTTSLGSICLGSLIVSAIEALRSVARSVNRENGNEIVACIVDCILGIIQAIAEFISKYAYVYVAVWGQDFCSAAKNTWGLLKRRGIDVIVNDDLSNLAFFLSAIIGGFAGAIIGGLVTVIVGGRNQPILAVMMLCFFLGMFLTGVAMSVLDGCVATFMVLWAEDPAPLATNHPGLHQKLVAAVRKMYPNIQGPI